MWRIHQLHLVVCFTVRTFRSLWSICFILTVHISWCLRLTVHSVTSHFFTAIYISSSDKMRLSKVTGLSSSSSPQYTGWRVYNFILSEDSPLITTFLHSSSISSIYFCTGHPVPLWPSTIPSIGMVNQFEWRSRWPVSYTHLDVYKRQH